MKKKILLIVSVSSALLIAGTVYAASAVIQKPVEEPVALPVVDYEVTEKTNLNEFILPKYESIQEKMLNAVDNFKNVKGEYQILIDHLDVDENIYFEITEWPEAKSYVKVENQVTNEITEHYFDGKNVTKIKDNAEKEQVSVSHINTNKPRGDRKQVNKDGEPVYIHRADPAFSGPAQSIILPQSYAFWLNDQTKNYEILGEETFLDRKVTVIEGEHDKDMAIKHNAENFKFWIDSETGVLLKLIETDQNGKITNLLEALDIQFNIE